MIISLLKEVQRYQMFTIFTGVIMFSFLRILDQTFLELSWFPAFFPLNDLLVRILQKSLQCRVILTPFIRSTMVFIFFTITNPSECKNLQNVWPWMSIPLFFRLNRIAGSSSSALRAYRSLLGPSVQKAWTCTLDPWLKSTSDFYIGNSTYPMMVRHD